MSHTCIIMIILLLLLWHHCGTTSLIKYNAHSCILGCLGPNDLQRVQDTIWKARVRWYNLGLGLGITPDSLDSIETTNTRNSNDCFRAMLTKWLREHQQPTWSAIAEALRSPSVGLNHLAEEILPQKQTRN